MNKIIMEKNCMSLIFCVSLALSRSCTHTPIGLTNYSFTCLAYIKMLLIIPFSTLAFEFVALLIPVSSVFGRTSGLFSKVTLGQQFFSFTNKEILCETFHGGSGTMCRM